jgi:hypothetical protein
MSSSNRKCIDVLRRGLKYVFIKKSLGGHYDKGNMIVYP